MKLPTQDETARALFALVTDMVDLHEQYERVRVQVNALATRHGVPLPKPLDPLPR